MNPANTGYLFNKFIKTSTIHGQRLKRGDRADKPTLQHINEIYLPLGFNLIPLIHGTKRPAIPNWPASCLTPMEIQHVFSQSVNVGLVLGPNLVDVDCDCPEAVELARELLPPTNFSFGRTGNPHSHYLYHTDIAQNSRKYPGCTSTSKKNMLCELRSTNCQTVLPPSIHPDGDRYELYKYGAPSTVKGDELTAAVRLIAAGSILAQLYPNEGSRNMFCMAIGALCLRTKVAENRASVFLRAIARIAGDEEAEQRGASLKYSRIKMEKGQPVFGIPTLENIIGHEGASLVAKYLEVERSDKFHLADTFDNNLDQTANGMLRPTRKNASRFLGTAQWLDVLAYDDRARRAIFTSNPPYKIFDHLPHAIDDIDITNIGLWLAESHGPNFSTQTLQEVVEAQAHNRRVDPVKEYLLGCKWDGTPRLASMLKTYFRADDSEYSQMVGKKWMISAVARTFNPGCQTDHMLLLEGAQGSGKSTAVRILASAKWHGGDPPDFRDTERLKEYIQGLWIIELSELAALGKACESVIKTLLTARMDRVRLPYGKRAVDFPRNIVFMGTTNESEYLRDKSGSRRVWPVACGTIDCDKLGQDRDQLWGEAVHRHKQGEPWHLIGSKEHELAEAQRRSRKDLDPWHTLIAKYLFPKTNAQQGHKRTTISEILQNALHLAPGSQGMSEKRRVGAILQGMGWERKQVREGGVQVSTYVCNDHVT
jgi:hypothetical protein